jgi:hypothetical protein
VSSWTNEFFLLPHSYSFVESLEKFPNFFARIYASSSEVIRQVKS